MEHARELGPEYVAKLLQATSEQREAAATYRGEELRIFLDVLSRKAFEAELEGVKDRLAAVELKQEKIQHQAALLRILSMESYVGFSKEAGVQPGLQVEGLFETAKPEYVQTLWDKAKPIRERMETYKKQSFPDSKKREPWLQQEVFIPLLQLLAEKSDYRLHGNNEKLEHTHNSTFSFPDAMLTRLCQFQLTAASGGPAFELEHTIEEKDANKEETKHDKQDHYHNGRGQVVKYMIVEALADPERPFFIGVLTDCSSIRFYKMENDHKIEFHESEQFQLLCIGDDKPTRGFALLANLFNTPSDRLSLPNVESQMSALIPSFTSFPVTLPFPKKGGSNKKVELTLEAVLGFGASSIAFVGKFDHISDVCIKIGFRGNDVVSRRQNHAQITQEILVLDALKSIPDVPKVLWAQDVKEGKLSSVLVTRQVGKTLNSTVLTVEQLRRVYSEVKLLLEEVHRQGYCHHDISPHNIICIGDLKPILIDWGLATRVGTISLGFSGHEHFSSVSYQANPLGYEYGARDDLESLIYSICSMHHSLPWMKKRHPAARLAKKTASTAAEICRELTFLIPDLEQLRPKM